MLCEEGELRADSAFRDRYMPEQYDWLSARLPQVIPFEGRRPWWGYCARPDLRTHRHRLLRGQAWSRIELNPPDESVFVMPLWAWNAVYLGMFLGATECETLEWQQAWERAVEAGADPELRLSDDVVRQSWELLFDPSVFPQGPQQGLDNGYEAVFWVLRGRDVSEVTPFVGAWSAVGLCRVW